ncbi:hypothetical protein EMMF5_004514 [Cystobasidiomycetes sp. EMM_F5]
MVFSPASRAFLAEVPRKPLTDEEVVKKAAEDERKKKVELLSSYQEKLDGIAKLEGEIYQAKLTAMQASPRMFAGNNLFSPHLNLGPGGLRHLVEQGGAPLLDTQQRLAAWLQANDPNAAAMSDERRAYVQQYQLMEAHLPFLKKHDNFDHFDDGADPLYAAEMRRRRRHSMGQCGRHYHDRPAYDPGYEPGLMSPEFERARRAERQEYERMGHHGYGGHHPGYGSHYGHGAGRYDRYL